MMPVRKEPPVGQVILRVKARRTTMGGLGALLLIFLLAAGGSALAVTQTPAGPTGWGHIIGGLTAKGLERRVDQLLARMTLAEKIRLLSGDPHAMSTQSLRALGIPRVTMSDASCGIVEYGRSTAYPASIGLAATWDRGLAQAEGRAIAHDALARGVDIVLGPGVNVMWVPQDGRNFEFLGEDPVLTADMAVSWIRGLQSRGVAACVKHFVGYEEGYDSPINSIVDRRALEEIYLPPFRAAVTRGHVWSIMCAYYRLNGVACASDPWLLTKVLRDHWGFKGVLMSDWGANHACSRSLHAGLDLEMPCAGHYSPKNILQALAHHRVSLATIDRHVRRILRLILAMHFTAARAQPDYQLPLDDPASAAVARRVAAEGTVLLKNQGHILPLHRRKLRRLVVWGPMARQPVINGGGSAYVHPIAGVVSMLDAITRQAGPHVRVRYIAVRQFPRRRASSLWGHGALITPDGKSGAHVEYFNNDHLAGPPVRQGTSPAINFNWGLKQPAPGVATPTFSARWTAEIRPARSGVYQFVSGSDDGSRVYLNGERIIDNWGQHAIRNKSTEVFLQPGRTYQLRIDYFNALGLAQMEFGYGFLSRQETLFSPADQRRIAQASVVLACVGLGPQYEHEGGDHGYHLPNRQGRVIRYLAGLNPQTIVVVNAGAPLSMSHWIHKVAGLVYAWYPGENGNTAVARILFGRIDPSGRLPDTFARHWRDEPAYGYYPNPGAGKAVQLAHGVYMGYRWFDKRRIRPLFPFGFGLSYTRFRFSNLKVTPAGTGRGRVFTVSVRVTNTGRRAGAQVAQLYIHPLVDRTQRCVQALKAFARVHLKPGQSQVLTMTLRWRDFAYFSTQKHAWVVPPGKYEIAVGSSSRDEPVRAVVHWSAAS